MNLILFVAALSISCSSPSLDSLVYPGDEWMSVHPNTVGIDSMRLDAAVNFLRNNSGRSSTHELLIIRSGRSIYQGDSIQKVHNVWSCTKPFTSTVLGLLIDDEKVLLDHLTGDAIPEMNRTYPKATYRHFTTMTSGYNAVGDTAKKGYTHGASQTPFRPNELGLFEPGTRFSYWDSAMNQFAHILTKVAGEPIYELFKRKIADPIGMSEQGWQWRDFGLVDSLKVMGGAGNLGKGIRISASDFARFGLLFLNEGKWDGKQLISKKWVHEASSVQVPLGTKLGHFLSTFDGSGVYGYNWWVNGIGGNGKRLWLKAPAQTYAASGFNNNSMFIIPEWDMVIVRLGLDASDVEISNATWSEFLAKVGESIIL